VQQQPGGARRSLAGTKMYIMDMLQLMRDMDASSMAVTIHTSEGEMEFIRNAIIATRLIAQKSSLSYGLRVVAKLRELVPQAHVPAIEALAQEFEAGPVTPP
jgi:predicted NAD/FAD-binding protein